MYYPRFKTKSKGVPILSKKDISIIAENYIRDFQPDTLSSPTETNIDLFVENYLHLELDYQLLSSDTRYLGMTVFNDTNKIEVFDPIAREADYFSAKAGTIIIDSSLLSESQIHRYRYTLGHESGHWVFHKSYYGYDPDQLTLFELVAPIVQCRDVNSDYYYLRDTKRWDDKKWMEWHADVFSSSLLMPETSIKLVIKQYSHLKRPEDVIKAVSYVFNVSYEAAKYRLWDLGIIKRNNIDNYEQLSLMF